jgi:hypothetical protein
MRLNSANSQFVFNLPTDFLPKEILDTYTPVLEKNWIQYENVIDYLNSTIKEISVPGLSIDSPTQIRKRGKEINYKPATNVQDIVASRQIDITFRSVDQDLNYWLLWDIFVKHYLDTEFVKYVAPFIVTSLDIHRDAIYQIVFREIILLTESENRLSYNDQAFSEKTFSLTLNFNWIDIDFLLNDSKVLELDTVDPVIQTLPENPDDYKATPIRKKKI